MLWPTEKLGLFGGKKGLKSSFYLAKIILFSIINHYLEHKYEGSHFCCLLDSDFSVDSYLNFEQLQSKIWLRT